ncbi:MAG: tetratricopeptide repeat-containing serine protease family protein [Cyanobacteria bacterium J06600_6]
MKNFISTAIGAVAIAFILPQATQAQANLSVPEIAQQAQEFTVKIEPPSGEWGSGVIVGQNGNTYYVLTASHVVSEVIIGEELFLQAFDGEKYHEYKIDVAKRELLPNNLDLALIQFNSDRQYASVVISAYSYPLYEHRDYQNNTAQDAQDSQQVFISGWPLDIDAWQACQSQQPAKFCQQPVFSAGTLFDNSATAISQPSIANPKGNFGGYELIYTNLTYPGMSGGAVLDTQGRLIGIHGRADGRKIGREDEIMSRYLDEVGKDELPIKIGLSLGLPIASFLASPSGAAISSYLEVEDSAPPTIALTDWDSLAAPQLVTDQNNPYHWIEKGNRLWRVGEPAMARGSFDRAIALQEDLYLAWFAKGFTLGFDRQYDKALEACDRAVELNVAPNNVKYESYRCQAGALQQLNRPEEALTALNRAMEIVAEIDSSNPNPADTMLAGELNFALGKYDLALQSLDSAVTMRQTQKLSDSALLYNNRALVKLQLGQLDSALADVEQAIATNVNFAPAYRNQGLILETMERNDESLIAYNRALELDPNDYNTWTNKGFTLYKLQRIDEAKQAFKQALEINPSYQPALDNLEAIE